MLCAGARVYSPPTQSSASLRAGVSSSASRTLHDQRSLGVFATHGPMYGRYGSRDRLGAARTAIELREKTMRRKANSVEAFREAFRAARHLAHSPRRSPCVEGRPEHGERDEHRKSVPAEPGSENVEEHDAAYAAQGRLVCVEPRQVLRRQKRGERKNAIQLVVVLCDSRM